MPRDRVVGVMSHLATADEPDESFARSQIERFREVVDAFPGVTAHLANSAGALRFPEARFDAVRCGVALYGLSPFGDDPAAHGLEPALSWESYVAQVRELTPGESTGYGRRYVAKAPVRIGIVPVGYADGFRRGLTGTEVLVGETRRRVVGTISMDALAVELEDEPAGVRGDADRRRGPGRGARPRARHDQLRDHLRAQPRRDPGRAEDRRWMTASGRPSARRPRGSSAARSATSSSAGKSSTSTSPARARSRPLAASRARRAAPSSRSRSDTAPGGSRSETARPSTSRRFTGRASRRISPPATSRSTRSRARWTRGRWSIPSAAKPTSRRGGCGR